MWKWTKATNQQSVAASHDAQPESTLPLVDLYGRLGAFFLYLLFVMCNSAAN